MTHKRTASAISDTTASQTSSKRQRENTAASKHSSDKGASSDRRQDRVTNCDMDPQPGLRTHQHDPSALAAAADVAFEEGYGEERPDMDQLLLRIYSGIRYLRSQHRKNLPIMQTTRFIIPLPPDTHAQGTALVLLRRAEKDGFATFILESSFYMVVELGMPIPYVVPEGAGVRLIHDAQWWVGKSAAEVKAGPHAEAKDVRRAEGYIKGLATKNEKMAEKSKRQREMEEKLREGVRRQESKGKMCDSDEDGERVWSESDSEVESEIGDDSAALD